VAIVCPHALYDEQDRRYRKWYSGGEQYEPNAIGYATSQDGLHWVKLRLKIGHPTPWRSPIGSKRTCE
jgi:hypothetical protein